MENRFQSYRTSPAVWNHPGECTSPLPPPGRPILDLPTLDGWKAEFMWVVFTYRDGLPIQRHASIQVLTGPGVGQLHRVSKKRPTLLLSISSPNID